MDSPIEMTVYWQNFSNYEDIRLYETGCQDCPPSYDFGPIIRDKYILHYVKKGEGVAYLDDKAFPVKAGQAFLLPPHVLTYYQADSSHPWDYIWIQFQGFKVTELLQKVGLTRKSPIYIPDDSMPIENCLTEILQHPTEEYYCMGKLYELFQIMLNHSTIHDQSTSVEAAIPYIQNVIEYINEKYSEPMGIQELASFCGLDRSYFSKIFKQSTGYQPQEYLIEFRMKKAKELLCNTPMSIQHISYSIGYNDALYFSRLFKKKNGMSPAVWRRKHTISS